MDTEQNLFSFFDLSGLWPGRPFAGFAAGDFVDMFGREVKLRAADMAAFVENTIDLVSKWKKKGMPGLPVDARQHDKGDAAGWIVGAEVGELDGTPVINLLAEWTELGVELITKKIMTNFSPTVDLTNKVIRGGSLTNWPATIDKDGVPLLSAVELAQGIGTYRKEGEKPMSDNKEVEPAEPVQAKPATTATPAAPVEMATPAQPDAQDQQGAAELMEELFKKVPAFAASRPEQLAELVQQLAAQMSERQLQALMLEQQQQWEITELSARLVHGGLPVKIPTLTEFFLSLNPAQFDAAKEIFGAITSHGLIDYAELGHARRLRKQPLPVEYHGALRETLKAGNTVADFFDAVGLGNPNDYDLSQFQGGK